MEETKSTESSTTVDTKKRYTGGIFDINKKKGYGFIKCREIEFTRIYFYWEWLIGLTEFNTLQRGDEVEFEYYDHPQNGPQAHKVCLIND